MSILKSTHTGKEMYWTKVLEKGKYEIEPYDGNINYYNIHCYFKYPFTNNPQDGFFLTEKSDLIAYIIYEFKRYFVKIQDIKQFELCELYWESKTNHIFGANSKMKTIELARQIIEYEHT